MIRVLIVEHEQSVADSLVALLEQHEFTAVAVASAEEALEAPVCDVVLAGLDLPGISGVELLRKLKQRDASQPILLLTGPGTVRDAVEAMRAGALDFLTKPIEPTVTVERLRKAAERRQIERERDRLRGAAGIVAESESMSAVLEEVSRIAVQQVPVLLTGESGCGKEVVATFLHEQSARRQGPLVRVPCGAVPPSLFEAEFFGTVGRGQGGASSDRAGWFAEADGGTLFLDEIETLPLDGQKQLLRAIETGEIRPVGATFTRIVDVRVVAATSEDLMARRDDGAFLPALYDRIAAVVIAVPPLRERREDLTEFARRFAAPATITPDAMETLRRHRWPGNVRELRNVIARARVEANEGEIQAQMLEPLLPAASEDLHLKQRVKGFERELFHEALRRADGKKAEAARLLGIDPSNWAYHAKRLNLQ